MYINIQMVITYIKAVVTYCNTNDLPFYHLTNSSGYF